MRWTQCIWCRKDKHMSLLKKDNIRQRKTKLLQRWGLGSTQWGVGVWSVGSLATHSLAKCKDGRHAGEDAPLLIWKKSFENVISFLGRPIKIQFKCPECKSVRQAHRIHLGPSKKRLTKWLTHWLYGYVTWKECKYFCNFHVNMLVGVEAAGKAQPSVSLSHATRILSCPGWPVPPRLPSLPFSCPSMALTTPPNPLA